MNQLENKDLFEQIHKHPLFQGVLDSEFVNLMEKCTLKHYNKAEKVLYSKTPREGLLLILTGMAEVYVQGDDGLFQQEVLEVLQTGDMIGFSSLADFLGEPNPHIAKYTVEVRAVEDSYCLKIPYSVVEARWDDETVRDFVLRQVAVRLRDIYGSLAEQVKLANQWGESDPFIRRIQDLMNEPVVSVVKDETVQVVAKKMVENRASSVVVNDFDGTLIGIITEKDIVQRVVANLNKGPLTARDVMTANPITISRYSYYYEAMSSFLLNGIKHLPVVEDEKVIGMVTLSDLLRKKNRGSMEILQKIEQSSFENLPTVKSAIYDVLGQLINDEIPTVHTLEIITKLYDRLVSHCLDLAVASLEAKGKGKPPVPFCWFQMGSGGRGEQFLLTDQDHFLVYENPDSDDLDMVEEYFALLGQEIVDHLHKAGYRLCIGKMMANEASWRGTVKTWQERLRGWALRATNDNVLLGHNFMSFRYLYGDDNLHDEFVKMVKEQIARSRIYLYRMAEQERDHPVPTLDHPIRALFGLRRDSIDIKKHALFPLHHCLQVLSAHNGIIEGTPLQRLDELVKLNVFTPEVADDIRFSYEIVLKVRVEQAWGRYLRKEEGTSEVKFTHLRSRDKEELMIALKTIRSLQNQTLGAFGMI
ncbi:DUF294 nucleotidyltransferase-like domain-containing protein [Alkalihalobacterium elongatum]|uniref:DUF294 nucleotidyltransferase-like domain-containing protein n=1 Tax=Alkalihalobacterium elongatum TaxID=2675466 RepID=UPI001C1F21BC|nr:DUF294 nucleotidyltransferase-like domain-containing protein [Alkalihalobacterium elongatum]